MVCKWDSLCLKRPEKADVTRVKLEMPTIENGTVPPRHLPNAQKRPREYLTPQEVEALMAVAKTYGRYGHRDATMIFWLIDMACGYQNYVHCDGTRSI
jgi:hypothetical protein